MEVELLGESLNQNGTWCQKCNDFVADSCAHAVCFGCFQCELRSEMEHCDFCDEFFCTKCENRCSKCDSALCPLSDAQCETCGICYFCGDLTWCDFCLSYQCAACASKCSKCDEILCNVCFESRCCFCQCCDFCGNLKWDEDKLRFSCASSCQRGGGRKWTKEEDELLAKYKNEQKTNDEIAILLGRTCRSVEARVQRIKNKANQERRVSKRDWKWMFPEIVDFIMKQEGMQASYADITDHIRRNFHPKLNDDDRHNHGGSRWRSAIQDTLSHKTCFERISRGVYKFNLLKAKIEKDKWNKFKAKKAESKGKRKKLDLGLARALRRD